MKKILFAFAAMAMIFATSCKKENVNEPMQESETAEMRAPLPGEFVANMDKGAMPQYAPSIEEGMGTMAHFDGKNVLWDAGDKIIVNGEEYSCSITNGTTAYFSNPDQIANFGGNTVYCPYYAFHGAVTGTGESAAGTLSATQTYNPANNASHIPMYAYSESGVDNPPLEFKNICGAIQIIVPLSTANKIVVTADEDINGTFTIVETGGKPKAVINNTNSTTANKSITLQRNSGTFQNGDIVYIAVPEGTYHHLEIKFMDGDNVEWTTGQSTKDEGYNIVVNNIHKVNMLGAFKGLLPGKFSVSATKKVRFTTGNLWYNPSTSQKYIENTQDGCTYSSTHIGHFKYNENINGTGGSTYLFCDENNKTSAKTSVNADAPTVGNLYALSADEWYYLIGANYTVGKYSVSTPLRRFVKTSNNNDTHIIVAPDGYNRPDPNYEDKNKNVDIQAYTKAGFLVLTNVGYGGNVNTTDNGTRYWTSTLGSNGAWVITFASHPLQFGDGSKTTTRAIRLVQDIVTTTPQ